jgi:hypothetical protein
MVETIVFFEVPDILYAACGEVVEDKYFVTACD